MFLQSLGNAHGQALLLVIDLFWSPREPNCHFRQIGDAPGWQSGKQEA